MRGELISQGAEARVYECMWLQKRAVVKHRFSKKYRQPDLDFHVNKDRLKAEARALVRCRAAGIRVPCLYDVDLDTREIIMERLDFASARDVIHGYLKKPEPSAKENTQSTNCKNDEPQSEAAAGEATPTIPEMRIIADKIGQILGKMHKNNIVHGDLTTSNIMIKLPDNGDIASAELYLIDFGLSSVEEREEDKAVDLYVLERAILSTHLNTKEFVQIILDSYKTASGKCGAKIIKKLDEVRMRGRKKLCFG